MICPSNIRTIWPKVGRISRTPSQLMNTKKDRDTYERREQRSRAHLAGDVGGLGDVLEFDVFLARSIVVDPGLHRLERVAGGRSLRTRRSQRRLARLIRHTSATSN